LLVGLRVSGMAFDILFIGLFILFIGPLQLFLGG
jgi:hypothetical protein